jgi:hypothetical protein
MASAAGTYTATTFMVQENGGTTDILADGGLITVILNADGTTAGRIFVPGGGEGGGDFDEDLAGTWTLAGTMVTLDHTADTFLRDMAFTVSGNRLLGEDTFGDVTITVVLAK